MATGCGTAAADATTATSEAISDTQHVESAMTIRSRIFQSGSRTLHVANCPQRSLWAEQAVTVNGPSIAWMTSATEIVSESLVSW